MLGKGINDMKKSIEKSKKSNEDIAWEYPINTDEVIKGFSSKAYTTKKSKSKEGIINIKSKKNTKKYELDDGISVKLTRPKKVKNKVKLGKLKVSVSPDKNFHKFIESHPELKVLEKGSGYAVVLIRRPLNVQVGYNQDGFQPQEFINEEFHHIAHILAWGSFGKKVGELAKYLLSRDAIVSGLVYHVMSIEDVEKWINRMPKKGMF